MKLQGATLVGVTGAGGSGKDSLAEVLVAENGFQRVAFADALYMEVADAFDVDVSFLRRRETKELPSTFLVLARCHDAGFRKVMRTYIAQAGLNVRCLSPRKVLQLWGTEYRRDTDDSYWLRALFDYMQSEVKKGRTKFVVTDCRFDNEAAMIRISGGKVVHIERPKAPKVSAHAREVPVFRKEGEAVVVNDGTLEEFQQKARVFAMEHSL